MLTVLGLAVPALPAVTSAQWTSPAPESGGSGGASAPGGTAPPGTGAPGGEPAQQSPCQLEPALRCPDLVMSAPFHLHLDRSTIRGHVLLRAASSIDSVGSGPMELRAHRSGGKMTVYQAIYDSSGHRHLFQTKARLIFKYVPGQRYQHPTIEAFSYWKLRHAAGFQLWALDAEGHAVQLVRTGPKVDYCLRDLIRSHPSPTSPRAAVYPACSQDPHMRSDVLGTSVGWSDVYPYEYPEQWIDVTGLRGRFAYVQVADPDNLLIESNHANDVSETYVELPSGRVFGHRVGVAAVAGAGMASAPNTPVGMAAAACVAHNGLPDKHCTPGALNPAVTQATIGKTICVKGWTGTVRPPSSATRRIKIEREIAYGIPAPHPKPFAQEELDHLIPLELGGAPEAIKNLWPEPRDGKLGYKRKDTLENRLKQLVCAHSLALKVAQKAIAVNWEAAYRKYVGAIP